MSENFKLNYPIETPEAWKFWSSKHKLNRIKAIIAFSLSYENANDNLRRHGYSNLYRKKYLNHYRQYINNHQMKTIPFSDTADEWWNPK